MIQRKKENWFRMLFIWHGSVLPQLLPRLVLLFILSAAIVYFKGVFLDYKIPLNPAPFTLFGIALALFLGFRNNASYDRFVEGRRLWGALLNDTRSLTRQALTLSGYPAGSSEVRVFVHYLICFTYCLKHQLRKTDPIQDLERWLPVESVSPISQAEFKPIMIMKEMALWVQNAKAQTKVDSITQVAFDDNFNKLSDIVGGCERIASTPIPYTYNVLLHRTVYLYCFLLPFGFVDSIGWFTPLIVIFIAYTFIALEAIADEIEEPFGTEPNDLALNEMSRMIESTLLEMVGEKLAQPPRNTKYIID